jgi:hypothetical protein
MTVDLNTAAKLVVWDHSGKKAVPTLPADTPPEYFSFVQQHRDAVLFHARNRWGEAPLFNVSNHRPGARVVSPAERRRYEEYARGQTPETDEWLVNNGDNLLACVALIEWQLADKKDPLRFVMDLEEGERKPV